MIKKIVIIIISSGLLSLLVGGGWFILNSQNYPIISPLTSIQVKETPLSEYSFPNLSTRIYQASPIELVGVIDKEPEFTAYQFAFISEGKRITGQVNLPTNYSGSQSPSIIMIRGFVDPSIYQTGIGTQNAASVFARNGYITFAPDFAGYGGSDPEDVNTFIARFQKPVTVLDLLESVKQLDYVDSDNIFLWGHSNGGQIALSVLEINSQPIPTTLWAPVSKPFPYNILYYTDEAEDNGKALRKSLAEFEADYDTDLFSIHNYLDRISAPIQIHQGGADEAVPISWSNQLVDKLNSVKDEQDKPKLEITYYTYPQADHNLRPNWNTVVARDLAFFAAHTLHQQTNQ